MPLGSVAAIGLPLHRHLCAVKVIYRQGVVQQVFMAQEALGLTRALEACALHTEVK